VGLLTVQLLRAHGCRVLGSDFDPERLKLARQFGAETVDLSTGQDPVAAAEAHTRGRGVDAVIITASTPKSEPVSQAARMCRKRGRIVLVGVTGLKLSRADFYEKELTFQVSCSYGPGRHDPSYEEKGNDYPLGFVRWTEQRNLEAVLDMMADGRLEVKPLISHRFPIEEAESAYALITGDEASMGVVLEYPGQSVAVEPRRLARVVDVAPPRASHAPLSVGFLGAGNYASAALIPAFRDAGVRLRTVVSATGLTGVHAARRFGFEVAATDVDAVLGDPAIDAVVIATRHDSHGELVCRALAAGKHVFVEKPLALGLEEVESIERELGRQSAVGRSPVLAVGFNRRFAPHVRRMAELLAGLSGPAAFVMTVNAGAIPAAHWTRDAGEGGGRIAGEACHFIDLLRFLAASEIVDVRRMPLAPGRDESAAIHLQFASGSTGVVHYLCQGAKSFPKERLEVFGTGKVLQLDNFRVLRAFGIQGAGTMRLWRQDKGQRACAQAFVDAAVGRAPAPIPVEQLLEVARVTIEAAQSPGLPDDGLA
jgi:predicted dehydrogenase